MKRFELDKAISQGSYPDAMMLYGESHYLIDYYTTQLSNIDDASTLNLYFDEYQFEAAKAHLSQGSLFNSNTVLIIKSEKKVPKKELDTLLALTQKQANTYFIYAYYGTDFKKSATAAFSTTKHKDAIRLFTPFPNEAIQIIIQLAQQENLTLNYEQAQFLLELEHHDLSLAANEVKKLALLEGNITTSMIERVVFGAGSIRPETFYIQFIARKPYVAMLSTLFEHGEDEIRICTGLSGFITQLYLFAVYIRIHGAINSSDVLGYKLPPKVEQERVQLCMTHSLETFQALLERLLICENELKATKSELKRPLLLAYLHQSTLLMQ